MRLHFSAIEKLVRVYENYGGHRNEGKLKNILAELDFSEYLRESGEKILVVTEDLQREQSKKG